VNPAGAYRPPAGPTPLTLLCAGDLAPALALALRWAAGRPPGERWALLIDDPVAPQSVPVQAEDGLQILRLASGCICCSGALALRTALARVLRDGPWQRLLLLPSAVARIDSLVDALRASLAAAWLDIDSIITLQLAGRAAPPGALEASPLVVDARHDPAAAQLAVPLPLASGPAGARLHVDENSRAADWAAISEILRTGFAQQALADAAPDGSADRSLLRWPGSQVFDRRLLIAALQSCGQARIERGLFRTARDWYRWSAGADPAWQPTGWRLDSRLLVCGASDEVLSGLRSRLQQCIAQTA
jgi:hypothetical protein